MGVSLQEKEESAGEKDWAGEGGSKRCMAWERVKEPA